MVLAVIQARCNSTRLPNKILYKINNAELLKFQIERVKKCKTINKLIVATSRNKKNLSLFNFCLKNRIQFFKGSENNVISRFFQIAKNEQAKIIVRLTADCPLVDPRDIDRIVKTIKKGHYDYVANTVPPDTSSWPDGSDVEAFTFSALKKVMRTDLSQQEKEHVTFPFWKRKNFLCHQITQTKNYSNLRYTLDYIEDFYVLKKIFAHFKNKIEKVSTLKICNYLEKNPSVTKINSKYFFGIGWKNEKSKHSFFRV